MSAYFKIFRGLIITCGLLFVVSCGQGVVPCYYGSSPRRDSILKELEKELKKQEIDTMQIIRDSVQIKR